NVHNNPRASADERAAAARAAAEKERQRRIAAAKAKLLNAAKALAKIMMDELGITDALDCFMKGDMGGCLATAVNVASSAVGGALGKLAARYGAPWKWKKFANLASRVKGLLGDLVDGARSFLKCRNSFMPGTLVVMADGSRKPIEMVNVNDVVLVTDPVSGVTAAKAVVATIIGQGVKNLVEVTIDADGEAGDATASVVATDKHPFWVPDLAEWVNAADLQAGQWLRTSAGTYVQVAATRHWSEPAQVYNLTVDDVHTYYVLAGDTSLLVHNCTETYYRAMSESHYDELVSSGKVSATGETMISPTRAFSEDYDGVLVKLTVKKGTTKKLEGIGVRDKSKVAAATYPEMSPVSGAWAKTNAFFKYEKSRKNPSLPGQINIGLGSGRALDMFNRNLVGFEKLK
ncbi:polymorphic toxin-type HINT domain-containing protein, partial [Micromonospora chokoriensis]